MMIAVLIMESCQKLARRKDPESVRSALSFEGTRLFSEVKMLLQLGYWGNLGM